VRSDSSGGHAIDCSGEVRPTGIAFSGIDLPADVTGAGNDFEALEKLRRLAFSDRVEEPKQLELWKQEEIGGIEKS